MLRANDSEQVLPNAIEKHKDTLPHGELIKIQALLKQQQTRHRYSWFTTRKRAHMNFINYHFDKQFYLVICPFLIDIDYSPIDGPYGRFTNK